MEENMKNAQAIPVSDDDLEAATGGMELDATLEAIKTNCRAYCARCHMVHDLADYGMIKISGKSYHCYHCNDSHRQFAVSPNGEYFAWSTMNRNVVIKDRRVY